MSELRTNRIIPRDGLPSGSSGGIIQIRESALTTGNVSGQQYWTTSSSSYVDVFSGTITPTRSDSKIFVNMGLGPYGSNSDTLRCNGQVLRDSTQVWYNRYLYFRSGGTFKSTQSGIVFLDSPATTSTITYKFQVKIEQSSSGSQIEFYAESPSFNNKMILMEISG